MRTLKWNTGEKKTEGVNETTKIEQRRRYDKNDL